MQALGGDSFVKGFVQAATYRRLRRARGAGGLRAPGPRPHLRPGEPLLLPLPDRFFAGGDYSLRGFRDRRGGPAGRQRPAPGRSASCASSTWRDLPRRRLRGRGQRLSRSSPTSTCANLRYTAGLGLRYRSALGPLRVDWGFKLEPARRASRPPASTSRSAMPSRSPLPWPPARWPPPSPARRRRARADPGRGGRPPGAALRGARAPEALRGRRREAQALEALIDERLMFREARAAAAGAVPPDEEERAPAQSLLARRPAAPARVPEAALRGWPAARPRS